MRSLSKYIKLSREEKLEEIEHISTILELTYNAFQDTRVLLLRGQAWKLESYLTLYYYLLYKEHPDL